MMTITDSQAEAVVELTETAAQQVRSLLAQDQAGQRKGLRIYVEEGGCSGMKHGLVFDEPRDTDLAARQHGVLVMVDPASAPHVRGSVVDYVVSLTDGGFKVFNPNARYSCGCGKSFRA